MVCTKIVVLTTATGQPLSCVHEVRRQLPVELFVCCGRRRDPGVEAAMLSSSSLLSGVLVVAQELRKGE